MIFFKKTLIGFILISFLIGCMPEANFRLSDQSRLPLWFDLPEGVQREDASVQLYYYSKPGGREAKFILRISDSWFSEKTVKGELHGLKSLRLGKTARKDYPRFEIVSSGGVTDIIMHKERNDVFYMVDDPAIWKELGLEKY